MSTRDLGSVTSYAMAVALGFEGTEAEWVTYMMEAGDNAASAAASAASAAASATSAEASAETARINYGSPLAAFTLSAMTEQNRVYVYTGVEQGMVYGDWYYYDGSGWIDGGVYNATAEGQGLTDNERALILSLFSKAAYAEDDAEDAYDQLSTLWSVYSVTWSGTDYTHGNTSVSARGGSTFVSTVTADGGHTISTVVVAMGGTTVQGAYNNGVVTIPNVLGDIVITVTTVQATVSSISAVYTQSGTVYDTDSLDSLKSDLVVTAHYTDSTSETVTTYTLSGTLSVGTSTITVSYGGKTTTFNVTVSAAPTVSSISATYTQSGTVYDTDSLDSLKTDLVVTATWSDSTTSTVASSDYTLSGTLAEGTSTVTVSYEGKTTTFNVTVTEAPPEPITSTLYLCSVEVGGTTTRYARFYSGNPASYSCFWAKVNPNTSYNITVTGKHFNRFRILGNNTFDPDNITYNSTDTTLYPLTMLYDPTQPSDSASESTVTAAVNSGSYEWLCVQVRTGITSNGTDAYALTCTIEEVTA